MAFWHKERGEGVVDGWKTVDCCVMWGCCGAEEGKKNLILRSTGPRDICMLQCEGQLWSGGVRVTCVCVIGCGVWPYM